VLRKRWLSIAIFAAVGVGLAAGYSLLSTKIYTATAQSFVAIGGTQSSDGGSVYNGASFALQRVKSYVEVVKSLRCWHLSSPRWGST
jgi:non-specific protein-tyrosine kinase